MINYSKPSKVLFVEPHEFGHVMLHLSAMFEKSTWNEDNCCFLISDELKQKIFNDQHLHHLMQKLICKTSLIKCNKFQRFRQCFQAVIIAHQNNCNAICFKYLDEHLFGLFMVRLLLPQIRISGIFFRPMLHYSINKYPLQGAPRIYLFLMWLKNSILKVFLYTKVLDTCFFQDEGAVEYYSSKRIKCEWLPTPSIDNELMEPPNNNKIVFLFFGQIAKRKGIYRIFKTWKLLPYEIQKRIELSIIGRVNPVEKGKIYNGIKELEKMGCKIHFEDRYIDNSEIRNIYKNVDIVLSPHDLQFGTSGVIIQSAIWQRPTIVHDWGWVGYFVKKYNLGWVIDTNNYYIFSQLITNIINNIEKIPTISREIAEEIFNKNQPQLYGIQLYRGILE